MLIYQKPLQCPLPRVVLTVLGLWFKGDTGWMIVSIKRFMEVTSTIDRQTDNSIVGSEERV